MGITMGQKFRATWKSRIKNPLVIMACWKIRHLQLIFSMKASIYSGLSVAIFAY